MLADVSVDIDVINSIMDPQLFGHMTIDSHQNQQRQDKEQQKGAQVKVFPRGFRSIWETWEKTHKKLGNGQAVVVHAFNPSTWEAEAGRFLSSRPGWTTELVSSKTARAIQRNPVSKNQKKKK